MLFFKASNTCDSMHLEIQHEIQGEIQEIQLYCWRTSGQANLQGRNDRMLYILVQAMVSQCNSAMDIFYIA